MRLAAQAENAARAVEITCQRPAVLTRQVRIQRQAQGSEEQHIRQRMQAKEFAPVILALFQRAQAYGSHKWRDDEYTALQRADG